jgi:hypothetical protein
MRRTPLAALLAVGCYLTHGPPAELDGEQAFEQRWRGHFEDELLVQYGKPDDVLMLSSGHRVLSYHREVSFQTSRAGFYGNAGSSRSDASTYYCDRRFEVEQRESRVVRAVITGSNCDYGR